MTRIDSIPDPHQNGKPNRDPHKKTVWIRNTGAVCSFADPGCLSRILDKNFSIPDPNFFIPDPGSRVKKILDPGSASKNLQYF
jgi:hypothetical protein